MQRSCTRNTFTGNTIDGVSNSTRGILIESAANPSTDNTATGNVVRLAGAGSCYAFIANFSSGPVSDNVFTGNHCVGTGAASEVGLTITDASGGAVGNMVAASQFANLPTGITIGAGVTNTQIDAQQFDTVTTHISDSGTGTAIQTLRFSSTGALASGTATVTFPNGGFSSAASYACTARDTTTPANGLTQGTFAAGSLVLTGTGTDGYAISCGGQ